MKKRVIGKDDRQKQELYLFERCDVYLSLFEIEKGKSILRTLSNRRFKRFRQNIIKGEKRLSGWWFAKNTAQYTDEIIHNHCLASYCWRFVYNEKKELEKQTQKPKPKPKIKFWLA